MYEETYICINTYKTRVSIHIFRLKYAYTYMYLHVFMHLFN